MQKIEALVLVAFSHCATAQVIRKNYAIFFSNEMRKDVSLASMCGMLSRLVKKKYLKCRKVTASDLKNNAFGYRRPSRMRVGTKVYTLTPQGKSQVMTLYNLLQCYTLSDKH